MSLSFPKFFLSKPHSYFLYTLYFGIARFACLPVHRPSCVFHGFSQSPQTPGYFRDYTMTVSFQISPSFSIHSGTDYTVCGAHGTVKQTAEQMQAATSIDVSETKVSVYIYVVMSCIHNTLQAPVRHELC
jgi:hypothetical protein